MFLSLTDANFYFISQICGFTPLHQAAFNGNVGCAQLLLERKAEVDPQNCYGRTAMMVASMRGHERVAKILLDANSSPNLKDAWGCTALDLAQQILASDLTLRSTSSVPQARVHKVALPTLDFTQKVLLTRFYQ